MGDGVAIGLKRMVVVLVAIFASLALGCGAPDRIFASEPTDDASSDVSSPRPDVGTGAEASTDTSSVPNDAGPDRTDAREAAADTAPDVSPDTAVDRAADVGPDADAGPIADVRPDSNATPDIVVADGWIGDSAADNQNQPPTIVGTTPANMATAVPVAATITIDFSKSMNPATVALVLNPAATLGSPIWNTGNTQIAFTPPSPLQANTSYTATVTGTDTDGRALAGPTSFSFATGQPPDTTAPTISSTIPNNNGTNVPASSNIVITFSEPMDIGSVQVTAVPDITLGMATWSAQNDQVTYTPTVPLLPSTEYNVTVAGQDRARNQLGGTTTFKFTTALPPDTAPPTVVSVAPPNGAMSVPNNTSIVITFSEGMNIAATTAALSISPAVTCNGGWSWNVGGTTTTCVPASPLAYMTAYTVGVGVGAQDLAGNALAAAFSSSFVTGVAPDTTPPTINSTVPGDTAVGVPRGTQIVVNFSEPMDINSAQTAFAITAPAGITGNFSWAAGNTQMVFTPSALFAYGTTVTWQVSTAARDAAGNYKTTLNSYVFYVIKSTTVNLPCVPLLDGYTFNNTTAGTTSVQAGASYIAVGWYPPTPLIYRGWTTYDLSVLPTNATAITSATMYVQQYQVTGTVYGATALGSLLWRHVDYGPSLDAADHTITQLPHTSSGGTLSTDATLGWKAAVVTLSLRDDLANRVARANRSQFLLRMTNDSDALNISEWSYNYSCDATVVTDRPYIQVTYEYP